MGERYCLKCDWEEGGLSDFGFLTMDERPSWITAPEALALADAAQ